MPDIWPQGHHKSLKRAKERISAILKNKFQDVKAHNHIYLLSGSIWSTWQHTSLKSNQNQKQKFPITSIYCLYWTSDPEKKNVLGAHPVVNLQVGRQPVMAPDFACFILEKTLLKRPLPPVRGDNWFRDDCSVLGRSLRAERRRELIF